MAFCALFFQGHLGSIRVCGQATGLEAAASEAALPEAQLSEAGKAEAAARVPTVGRTGGLQAAEAGQHYPHCNPPPSQPAGRSVYTVHAFVCKSVYVILCILPIFVYRLPIELLMLSLDLSVLSVDVLCSTFHDTLIIYCPAHVSPIECNGVHDPLFFPCADVLCS